MTQLSNENELQQEIETIKSIYSDQVTISTNPLSISCIIQNDNYIIEATFIKSKNDNLIINVTNAKSIEKHSKKFLKKLESKLNSIYKDKKLESDSMPIFECISYLNESLNDDINEQQLQVSDKKKPKHQKHKTTNKSNNRFRSKHNDMVKNNEKKTDVDEDINGYEYFYAYNYKHYVKDALVTDKYVLFYKDVFSQWFPSKFTIDNIKYVNCEQYMMAEKAKLFNDKESLKLILSENDPSKIIKLGRRVTGFKEKIWIQHRENIVYKGNFAKFTQNEMLKKKLLSYDNSLYFVEASGPDKIWGIGLDVKNPKAQNKNNWKGLNLLGKAITKVRNDILQQNL